MVNYMKRGTHCPCHFATLSVAQVKCLQLQNRSGNASINLFDWALRMWGSSESQVSLVANRGIRQTLRVYAVPVRNSFLHVYHATLFYSEKHGQEGFVFCKVIRVIASNSCLQSLVMPGIAGEIETVVVGSRRCAALTALYCKGNAWECWLSVMHDGQVGK